MAPPLLTVAIPTLSRLAYLREAVDSALRQDYPAFEVLVSNDGKDDAIRQYMRQMVRMSERVRYIETPGRLGLSGNWNWCADHAAGTHLVIIGDDDRLLPEFLSSLVPHTANNDVVFCNHFLINGAGQRMADSEVRLAKYGRGLLSSGQVRDAEQVAWMNAVAPSATLVRTGLVKRLRFHEALNTPELEFYVRAARDDASFYFDKRYLAEYRTHLGAETVRGLWFDRLLFSLLAVEARTDAGKAARDTQLRTVARTAAVQALAAGRTETAASIMQTGLVTPRSWKVLLKVLIWSGATLSPRLVSAGRSIRRLGQRRRPDGQSG